MYFSIFSILLLIGISNGLITSVVLLRSRHNVRSNRFLALAIITLCFLCTKKLWFTSGLWDTPYIRYFPIAGETGAAPMLYFFLLFLFHSNLKFTWKHALHFLPFAVFQLYALVVYFYTLQTQDLTAKDNIAGVLHFVLIKDIEEYLGVLINIIYITLGYKQMRAYRTWLNNTTADSKYPDFNWLWWLFTFSFILGGFLALNHFLNLAFDFNNKYNFQWKAFNLYMAFVAYYLGFVAYKQSHVEVAINQTNDVAPKATTVANQELSQMAQRLESMIAKEKIFLNPTLSLQEVAQLLAVNPRNLSQVINSYFGKSFRELINHYRVEEVKAKLNDENLEKHSILGIALDCGFNSEASFYRIFKKATGMSPSQYKNHQTNQ